MVVLIGLTTRQVHDSASASSLVLSSEARTANSGTGRPSEHDGAGSNDGRPGI
jgi:hypothetical protein